MNTVAIRVVGRSPSYKKPKNRYNWLKPSEILNKMQSILQEKGAVSLGITYTMNLERFPSISEVLLFADSMGDSFVYKARVKGIVNNYSLKESIPGDFKEYELPYWAGEPCSVWFLFDGLELLSEEDIVCYENAKGIPYSEVWKTPRYRVMYLTRN